MAMKICPVCKENLGPRTLKCSKCNHEFSLGGVKSTVPMTNDPLIDLKSSVSNVKTTLQNIESRSKTGVNQSFHDDFDKVEEELTGFTSQSQEVIGKQQLANFSGRTGNLVYAPAGDCPFKPEGFKDTKWANGPASDDVVQNWAIRVFNSGTDQNRFHPHAVVYWARFFWEMQTIEEIDGEKVVGREWQRVKDLILDALTLTNNRI